jgi:peptidoglycan-N-acetylglucosamine deacetylase
MIAKICGIICVVLFLIEFKKLLMLTGILIGLIYIFQSKIIRKLAYLFPEVRFFFDTTEKIIALTIDDIPGKHLREILRVLAKYHVSATFFTIGSYIMENDINGLLIKEMKRDHEIGNHTMENRMSIKLSDDELIDQIVNTEKIVGDNYWMKWFRPGSGFFTNRMIELVKNYGYKLALGDVYPHDPIFRYKIFARLNAEYIIWNTKPGSIIILHDVENTVDTLEIVLDRLTKKGYKIMTLSEMNNKCTR